jgi:hypothetical protein
MKKTEKIRKNLLMITIRYTERDGPFNIWEKAGDNMAKSKKKPMKIVERGLWLSHRQ